MPSLVQIGTVGLEKKTKCESLEHRQRQRRKQQQRQRTTDTFQSERLT